MSASTSSSLSCPAKDGMMRRVAGHDLPVRAAGSNRAGSARPRSPCAPSARCTGRPYRPSRAGACTASVRAVAAAAAARCETAPRRAPPGSRPRVPGRASARIPPAACTTTAAAHPASDRGRSIRRTSAGSCRGASRGTTAACSGRAARPASRGRPARRSCGSRPARSWSGAPARPSGTCSTLISRWPPGAAPSTSIAWRRRRAVCASAGGVRACTNSNRLQTNTATNMANGTSIQVSSTPRLLAVPRRCGRPAGPGGSGRRRRSSRRIRPTATRPHRATMTQNSASIRGARLDASGISM